MPKLGFLYISNFTIVLVIGECVKQAKHMYSNFNQFFGSQFVLTSMTLMPSLQNIYFQGKKYIYP